jgi:hypothetical protein
LTTNLVFVIIYCFIFICLWRYFTKTSSAKAKGRKLQQQVRDDLLTTVSEFGMVSGDIESRSMGASGEDLMFSPSMRRVFNSYIECKNQEALNVIAEFQKHFQKYQEKGLPLLVHKKNRTEVLVTMRWKDFLQILTKALPFNGNDDRQKTKEIIHADIPPGDCGLPSIQIQ